ncbi:hypothetical protein GCM10027059_26700 [Myceligenerans halotolerans]
MSDYTPTTDEVRGAWVTARCTRDEDIPGQVAEFDRWLAEHDREVAARALEATARAWQRGEWANAPRYADPARERIATAQHVTEWLRARAKEGRA